MYRRKVIVHLEAIPGTMIHIRKAELQDVQLIAKNNLRVAMESEGLPLDEQLATEGVRMVICDPSLGFYLIAQEDEVLIGQCLVTPEWSDWRCGVYWWLQSVYVLPSRRGEGVFSELFRHLIQVGKENGILGLRLYVHDQNDLAREVYRRLGMKSSPYHIYDIMISKTGEEPLV